MDKLSGFAARLLVLLLGAAGTAGAALASCFALVLASVIATIVVLAIQFVTTGPAVIGFVPSDWKQHGGGYYLEISWHRHGRRNPVATMWLRTDEGGMEQVIPDIYEQRHEIRITVNRVPAREGEIRIS